MAGRTHNGLAPGRREFRVRAQRRDCMVPGSQERRALGPELLRTRRTSTPTARSPESGPGPEYECVCVGGWGVGGRVRWRTGAGPRTSLPQKTRVLLCMVALVLQAAQSRSSSWGEGRGAGGRDPRRDRGSYRALAEWSSRPRTALGAHLVAPARPRMGAGTLAGSSLKGLPGPVPGLTLLQRRLG